MSEVWPDSFVSEASLTQNISVLRRALGEGANGEQFIQTIPKRGYVFTASVREVQDEDTKIIVETDSPVFRAAGENENGALTHHGAALTAETDVGQKPGLTEDGRHIGSRRTQGATLLAICGALLVLTLAFAPLWISSRRTGMDKNEVRSLAVLPFKHVSGEGADEALELGMADALIARLSHIRQISVRPTRAILKYTERGQDLLDAGRALGVDAVLDGTVQKSDDRVRVTVQLVSVRDGKHLWSETFDEQWTNIFALQDAVSNQVARSLALQITTEEREQIAKRHTRNTEAYEAYLKGRYFWNQRTPEGFKKGIEYFQQAIDIDPIYAQAYAGLADSYALLGVMGGVPGKEVYPKAKAAALKALEIDDTLGEAHASLAVIKFWYEWDFEGAEREFKRAIELNPNHSTAHHWYAFYLATGAGRPEEAIAEIKRAQELDPLSLIISTDVGSIYVYAGRYDEAIEWTAPHK